MQQAHSQIVDCSLESRAREVPSKWRVYAFHCFLPKPLIENEFCEVYRLRSPPRLAGQKAVPYPIG